MSDIVEQMASRGELSDEEVERIGNNVAAFVKEAKENPELFDEAVEKLAFMGLDFSHLNPGQVGANVLVAGGMTAAAAGGAKLIDVIGNAIGKARNYKSMLAENPDLAKVDSKQVQRAYNTLHNFNPEYASDPLVAGTFVRNVIETARLPMETVNSIVQARKNMEQRGGFDLKSLPVNLLKTT